MKLQPLIYLSLCTIFLLSCKGDKPKETGSETITINGAKAPSFGIEVIETPTEADNGNYIEVEIGEEVTLTYTGIEKDKITWTYDGMPLGDGTSLVTSHTWSEPGIKEIKATRSDGQGLTVFVRVKENGNTMPPSEPEPALKSNPSPPQPAPVPKPSRPDRDKDGVPDDMDECPDQQGLKKLKGCPDSDGDGIPDHLDNCPNIFGKSKDGCPKEPSNGQNKKVESPSPPADRDGDGVPDSKDKCPDIPGLPKYEGCPDTDGDGIPDHLDKCPNEKGIKSNDGCPAWVPNSTGKVGKISSIAAIGDEKDKTTTGGVSIKPLKNLIIHEAKIVASGDGKISITLEGDDIKRGITIEKYLNKGHNTILFNDFKNNVLKEGNSYTITYEVEGNIEVTIIKSAYASGTSNGDIVTTGRHIFYDLTYKY